MSGMWLLVWILAVMAFLAMFMVITQKKTVDKEFEKLLEETMTEENKDYIERLCEFHAIRMKNGADVGESRQRLVNDIKRVKDGGHE